MSNSEMIENLRRRVDERELMDDSLPVVVPLGELRAALSAGQDALVAAAYDAAADAVVKALDMKGAQMAGRYDQNKLDFHAIRALTPSDATAALAASRADLTPAPAVGPVAWKRHCYVNCGLPSERCACHNDTSSYAPTAQDAARVPEIAALIKSARALRADMLERAQIGMDAIHGEQYRIVNAGRTAWADFDAALRAIGGDA